MDINGGQEGETKILRFKKCVLTISSLLINWPLFDVRTKMLGYPKFIQQERDD